MTKTKVLSEGNIETKISSNLSKKYHSSIACEVEAFPFVLITKSVKIAVVLSNKKQWRAMTVKEVHSEVRTYTLRMQTYCVTTFPAR